VLQVPHSRLLTHCRGRRLRLRRLLELPRCLLLLLAANFICVAKAGVTRTFQNLTIGADSNLYKLPIAMRIGTLPVNRQTVTILVTTFLASDYFWYKQNHWLVKSIVWRPMLRSNNSAATKPVESGPKSETP